MEEISKTRMELAIRNLERKAVKIEGVRTFRGVPVTAFDKEHLVMLCQVFAEEWHKAQMQYHWVLDHRFPSYIAGAVVLSDAVVSTLYKPSIWRKAWKKLKQLKPKKA